MTAVGVMAMPADFRYREVFLKGKPQHDRWDPFRVRHPVMESGRRAKIFSPFDALRGFSEAVVSKDVIYEPRTELWDDREELDRRLRILKELTRNRRMARANQAHVTVTHYTACTDKNSEAYGERGLYRKSSGICRNVDPDITRSILIDEERISFENIRWIESADGLFEAGCRNEDLWTDSEDIRDRSS